MKRHSIFLYSLKVWITALIVPPILFLVFPLLQSGSMVGDIAFSFILSMIIGGILSFPSWFLLFLLVHAVNRLRLPMIYKKMMLVIGGIFLSVFPFFLLADSGWNSLWGSYHRTGEYYTLVIVAGILLFHWDMEDSKNQQ